MDPKSVKSGQLEKLPCTYMRDSKGLYITDPKSVIILLGNVKTMEEEDRT